MCCFKRLLIILFDSGYERNNFIINSIIKEKVHDFFKNISLSVAGVFSHEHVIS